MDYPNVKIKSRLTIRDEKLIAMDYVNCKSKFISFELQYL